MKRLFILISLLAVVFLYSCAEKRSKQSAEVTLIAKSDTVRKLSIKLIGTINFRKTYAGLQFIENEKEVEAERSRIDKSNPGIDYQTGDSIIYKQFEKIGFVKDGELLLKKFRYDTAANTELKNDHDKIISIKFHRPSGDYIINLSASGDTASIKIDDIVMELKYSFLDVIPGGYKELVVLNEWYLIMGYMFTFLVYEIKD